MAGTRGIVAERVEGEGGTAVIRDGATRVDENFFQPSMQLGRLIAVVKRQHESRSEPPR